MSHDCVNPMFGQYLAVAVSGDCIIVFSGLLRVDTYVVYTHAKLT